MTPYKAGLPILSLMSQIHACMGSTFTMPTLAQHSSLTASITTEQDARYKGYANSVN